VWFKVGQVLGVVWIVNGREQVLGEDQNVRWVSFKIKPDNGGRGQTFKTKENEQKDKQ
jgi:hypothetical protein